jgi:hypothetical protein
MLYTDQTIIASFMGYVRKESDCWIWTGSLDHDGYGRFWLNSKTIQAHRVAYLLFCGEIDTGLWVLHSCDNPPCVKPDHLFLGTHQDNMDDKSMKGRQATGLRNGRYTHPESCVEGVRNGRSSLTEKDVLAIRSRYASGELVYRELACLFDVSIATVARIINREHWTHI